MEQKNPSSDLERKLTDKLLERLATGDLSDRGIELLEKILDRERVGEEETTGLADRIEEAHRRISDVEIAVGLKLQ